MMRFLLRFVKILIMDNQMKRREVYEWYMLLQFLKDLTRFVLIENMGSNFDAKNIWAYIPLCKYIVALECFFYYCVIEAIRFDVICYFYGNS